MYGKLIASAAFLPLIWAVPAQAQSAGHVLRGAGIGAAGGAVVGAIVPGLSVGKAALIGAAGGAVYNSTINKHGHRYHRRYRHHKN